MVARQLTREQHYLEHLRKIEPQLAKRERTTATNIDFFKTKSNTSVTVKLRRQTDEKIWICGEDLDHRKLNLSKDNNTAD